jgi:WD40 repeat protein
MVGLFVGGISPAQAPPRGAKKRPPSPNQTPGAGVQPKAVFVKFPDWVACVAFSPDNRTLAAGSYGVVKLLDVVEKQELAALPEPAGFVKSVAFSADGKTLVTGSYQSLASGTSPRGRSSDR